MMTPIKTRRMKAAKTRSSGIAVAILPHCHLAHQRAGIGMLLFLAMTKARDLWQYEQQWLGPVFSIGWTDIDTAVSAFKGIYRVFIQYSYNWQETRSFAAVQH